MSQGNGRGDTPINGGGSGGGRLPGFPPKQPPGIFFRPLSGDPPPMQVIQGKLPPQHPNLQQAPPRPIHHYIAAPPRPPTTASLPPVAKTPSAVRVAPRSAPQIPPPVTNEAPEVQKVPDPFKSQVELIKKNLRTTKGFSDACAELLGLISNKSKPMDNHGKVLYDACQVVYGRRDKPGFDAAMAKAVLDAAYERKSCFTPGFAKNIIAWRNTITGILRARYGTSPASANIPKAYQHAAPATTAPRPTAPKPKAVTPSTQPKRPSRPVQPQAVVTLPPLNPTNPQDLLEAIHQLSNADKTNDGEQNIPQLLRHIVPEDLRPFLQADVEPDYWRDEFPGIDTRTYPFYVFENPPLVAPARLQKSEEDGDFTATFKFGFTEDHKKKSVPHLPPLAYAFVLSLQTGVFLLTPDSSRCIKPPRSLVYTLNDQEVTFLGPFKFSEQVFGNSIDPKLIVVGENTFCITTDADWGNVGALNFSVRLVKCVPPSAIIAKVVGNAFPIEVCEQMVIDSFLDGDSDIQEVSMRVSVRDPVSMLRIKVPVRSVSCRHVQCFDAATFLNMCQNHPKFACPVCSTMVFANNMVTDSYIQSILDSIKDDHETEEVVINPDGTWKVMAPSSMTAAASQTSEEVNVSLIQRNDSDLQQGSLTVDAFDDDDEMSEDEAKFFASLKKRKATEELEGADAAKRSKQ